MTLIEAGIRMHEHNGRYAPSSQRRSVPLVGRRAEIEIIERECSRVVSGASSILLFEGEAGIGKSRLLTEAVDLAQRRGLVVLCGAADELSPNRPLGVVTDA